MTVDVTPPQRCSFSREWPKPPITSRSMALSSTYSPSTLPIELPATSTVSNVAVRPCSARWRSARRRMRAALRSLCRRGENAQP